MKILLVHNFHQKGSASGDDIVFRNESKMLKQHNNTVIEYTVSNDSFFNSSFINKGFAVLGMLWSVKHYSNIRRIIKKEKPDIMHVHTFFPLLSPSILYAAKKERTNVVATLHDTRFVCPVCTSLRNNQICNDCIDGKYFRMCKYGCFKQSKFKSLIVAFMFNIFRNTRVFYKKIDKYICLNDMQIELLKKADYDDEKIRKKYNFIEDIVCTKKVEQISNVIHFPNRYVVYYGRIGEEKGIRQLMKMWQTESEIPLVVMGSGPLEEEFSLFSSSKENVYFLGYTQYDKCISIVQKAEFVVFPSIWYEGCSMVEIESECLKKPIIAFDIGFSSEAIQNDYNGYKIPLSDIKTFMDRVHELWNDPGKIIELGNNARKEYITKFDPKENYEQLIAIYKELL